jgi:DNA repair photolyase
VNVQKAISYLTGTSNSVSGKQFQPYIKQRIPFQWGGLSDPFDMYEKKYGIGLQILKPLAALKYPICFSTKSTWWAYDDRYREVFRDAENWNVKVSIICLNEIKAKLIERGVPSPWERLQAIEEINEFANGVTLRLRPFILGMSDCDYEDLIVEAKDRGASAVSTEFFCLESRAHDELKERYNKISEVVGFDILNFYQKNSSGSGYLRLNWRIKEKYINKMEALCKKLGLRFYVSDADFKERSCNGSCCGLDKTWNYSRGQLTEVLVTSRKRYERYLRLHPVDILGAVKASTVKYDEFYSGVNELFGFRWRHAQNYNTGGSKRRAKYNNMTMADFIRYLWNTPKEQNSPWNYFSGLLKPVSKDENGNLVYVFNPSRR